MGLVRLRPRWTNAVFTLARPFLAIRFPGDAWLLNLLDVGMSSPQFASSPGDGQQKPRNPISLVPCTMGLQFVVVLCRKIVIFGLCLAAYFLKLSGG